MSPERARFHVAYQPRNVMGRHSLYMNWGLWGEPTEDLDEAARALVLRLGELAGLGPGTTLLDVGFGFGDQLIDWCRHTGLGRAEGINICPEQTAIAQRRVTSAGLAPRVTLRVGDAVALPFEAGSFDAVTAVECAFHFRSRELFFRQAWRVLKEGGRLVLADFIGTPRPGTRQRLAQRVCAAVWSFAPGSFCTPEEYVAALERAGFQEVTLERVTHQVIPPGLRYARRRLWEPDLRRRMMRGVWLATAGVLAFSRLLGDALPGEYVLVRAVRPPGAPAPSLA